MYQKTILLEVVKMVLHIFLKTKMLFQEEKLLLTILKPLVQMIIIIILIMIKLTTNFFKETPIFILQSKNKPYLCPLKIFIKIRIY